MKRAARKVFDKVLLIVVAVYAILIPLAIFSDRLIFQPQPSSYQDADLHLQSNAQVVKLRSGDKTITAVYLPNAAARYLLLFSDGNAEDIGNDLPWLEDLHDAGFAVFAYDYRGYGTSEGRSSEKFRNIEKIRDIHVPVLVIQGENDHVVPTSHGKRIFAAANAPKYSLWIPGAGHNDVIYVAPERYIAAVKAFANSLGKP